jgi:hypothetical protein
MGGISEIVAGLRREEASLLKQLAGITNAISSLEFGARGGAPEPAVIVRGHQRGPGRPRKVTTLAVPEAPKKKRKMSAKARKAISDAQKARWAKQKAGTKK